MLNWFNKKENNKKEDCLKLLNNNLFIKVTEKNYVFYNNKQEYLKKYFPKDSIAITLIEDKIKVLLSNDFLFYDKIIKEWFSDNNLILLIDKLRNLLGLKEPSLEEELSINETLGDSNKLALEFDLSFNFTEENINSKLEKKFLDLANKSLLIVKDSVNNFLKKEQLSLKIKDIPRYYSISKGKDFVNIEGLGETQLPIIYRHEIKGKLKDKESLKQSMFLYDLNSSTHSLIFIKTVTFFIDTNSYFTVNIPISFTYPHKDSYETDYFPFWKPIFKAVKKQLLYRNGYEGYSSLSKEDKDYFTIPDLYLYSLLGTKFMQDLKLNLNGEIIKDFPNSDLKLKILSILNDKLHDYFYSIKHEFDDIQKIKELEEKTEKLNKNYKLLLKLNNVDSSQLDKKTQNNLESIKKVLNYKKIIDDYIEKINEISKEIN